MKKFLSILLCLILVMSVFNSSFAEEDTKAGMGPQGGRKVTLSMDMIGKGEVSPAVGDYEYRIGCPVTLKATAAACYEFVEWQGNLNTCPSDCDVDVDQVRTSINPKNAEITVYMCCDRQITAVFRQKTYDLTTTASGPGVVMPTLDHETYDCGTTEDLLASHSACGYFVRWDGNIGKNSATDASITVTMDENRDITAVFETYEYSLDISYEGQGYVVPSDGIHKYDCGEVVELKALATGCSVFDHWEGDVANASSATTTVTINEEVEYVKAFFRDDTCPCDRVPLYVYVYEDMGGTASPAGTTYHCVGDVVPLLASPDSGYEFVSWRSVDGEISEDLATESSVTIPTGGATVAATFKPIATGGDCTLIVNYGPGGTASPAGVTVVSCGTTIMLEAFPDPGCEFYRWFGYQFDDPDAEVTEITIMTDLDILAEFSCDKYWLTIEIEGNGDVAWDDGYDSGVHNGDDQTWHASGAIVELDPDPASGWYFYGWDGPDESYVSGGEIVMNDNKELTAEFRRSSSSSSGGGGIFIEHTLNISVEGNGTVDPFVGSKKYTPGTLVDLGVDPAAGWTFAGWFGSDGDAVVNEQIEMDGDKTIIARFETTITETPPPLEPPIETPEIEIPLVETPLGGGDLPDTSQSIPMASLLVGFYMMGLSALVKRSKR